MERTTVVVYSERRIVVLDVDRERLCMSPDEAREIAAALATNADRCDGESVAPLLAVYKLGA